MALAADTNNRLVIATASPAAGAEVTAAIDANTAANTANTAANAASTAALASGLVGTNVAVVANVNVIGGIPLVFRIDLAAGALANTDVVMTHKVRVIDAFLVLRGAGVSTTTLQVKNGTSAITDAMAASGSDKDLVRAAVIDDAAYEIAAAGTLRVTSATGATQPAATVYVTALRVS